MLAKAIHSSDEKEQLAACSRLRRLLSVIGVLCVCVCVCGGGGGGHCSQLMNYFLFELSMKNFKSTILQYFSTGVVILCLHVVFHTHTHTLVSDPHPPIEEVIGHGCLPRLVSFLGDFSKPMLQVCTPCCVHLITIGSSTPFYLSQFEAAWVLTNIASGSTLQTRAVIEAGAIPALIQLLGSPHEYVLEQVSAACMVKVVK